LAQLSFDRLPGLGFTQLSQHDAQPIISKIGLTDAQARGSFQTLVRLPHPIAYRQFAVIASGDGLEQPLLGRYEPQAAEPLHALMQDTGISLRRAVAEIGPRVLELEDPQVLFNINAPEDLLQAAALLDRR